jgi:hypothetical protein
LYIEPKQAHNAVEDSLLDWARSRFPCELVNMALTTSKTSHTLFDRSDLVWVQIVEAPIQLHQQLCVKVAPFP